MPPRIASIARRHLQDPVDIQIVKDPVKPGVAPRVHQTAFLVARPHKVAALARILDMASPTSTLVFCRTRLEVDELTSMLNSRGHRSEGIHGGMNQAQRDRVMASFRSGKTDLLVATDVAARGLDISHVSHVMNYDVPASPEGYVHRIGRTGRAGRGGEAFTLVEPRERWLLKNIERLTKSKIEMATLPTVADLQAKRLERIGASIQKILTANQFGRFRKTVQALTEDFDPGDVAAAAIQLAYGSKTGERKEEEIPVIQDRVQETSQVSRRQRREPSERPREVKPRGGADRLIKKRDRGSRSTKLATLYFKAGRIAGIRPGDLVGAIANEAGINSQMIGPIKIEDHFSLVRVPEEMAQGVLKALSRTRLKGKRVKVRIDRE
jgi:ATP-dependent RNA helicase DeaD